MIRCSSSKKLALVGLFAGFAFCFSPFVYTENALGKNSVATAGPVTAGLSQENLLAALYDGKEKRPLWLRGASSHQPYPEKVFTAFDNAGKHGLDPSAYHPDDLRAAIRELSAETLMSTDIHITRNVLKYLGDLSGLRGKNSPVYNIQYWRAAPDLVTAVKSAASARDPSSVIESYAPQTQLYKALQVELSGLSRERNEPQKRVKIGSTFKLGDSDPSIPLIRKILGLDGSEKDFVYDDALGAAIMRFQRKNALFPDGVIGPGTVAALNRTRESRIAQITANLERLRWMEEVRPNRYILVNIPSATLWAVENGAVAVEMPVIVGKAQRQTFSFKTDITGVRFNPTWTVPPTIKKDDFLPLLQSDPLSLAKRGIRITYNGEVIDPQKVDWKNVTARGMGNLRMVQSSGDDNPLGKIRVIMANPYDIYLHDTNRRENFATEQRTLSSGCVRLAEPERLADFILKNNPGWSWDEMNALIQSGKTTNVSATMSLPVYLTYQTVWTDSAGSLVYGKDVYGQDRKLNDFLHKFRPNDRVKN